MIDRERFLNEQMMMLPAPLRDFIETIDDNEYIRPNNRFSTTELVYCLRRAYFARKHPKPSDVITKYNLFRGKIFDKITQIFERSQVKIVDALENGITIAGIIDAIVGDTVIEIKSISNIANVLEKPKREHYHQAAYYAAVLSEQEGVDYNLMLIYFDMSTFKVHYFSHEKDALGVSFDYIKKYVRRRAQTLHQMLKEENPALYRPSPDEQTQCIFCPYLEECFLVEKQIKQR